MNRLIMAIFPFLGIYIARQVLSGPPAQNPDGAAAAPARKNQFIEWIITKLSDAFGTGALPHHHVTVIALGLMIYSAVMGHMSSAVLGRLGFGRTLNGLLCLSGTFLTLLAYAKIFGQIAPERLALIVILMMAGSIITLLAACAIKAWISHQTEAVMIGNYSGAKSVSVSSQKPKNSSSARLDAIANRNRK